MNKFLTMFFVMFVSIPAMGASSDIVESSGLQTASLINSSTGVPCGDTIIGMRTFDKQPKGHVGVTLYNGNIILASVNVSAVKANPGDVYFKCLIAGSGAEADNGSTLSTIDYILDSTVSTYRLEVTFSGSASNLELSIAGGPEWSAKFNGSGHTKMTMIGSPSDLLN